MHGKIQIIVGWFVLTTARYLCLMLLKKAWQNGRHPYGIGEPMVP